MNKRIFPLLALLLLSACKTTYTTATFDNTPQPTPPNYADASNWAVLPNNYPQALVEIVGEYVAKDADVFFVYPTLLTDKKDPSWNADIQRNEIRESVINQSVKYQASAFAAAGNLYVPFYRQSHYKIYVAPHKQEEEKSRKLAYSDVRAAFQYYLKHHNKGRPIIIASHSQGSIMCGMLLKEFFDGTPLQDQLIAAYIPGIKFTEQNFEHLNEMDQPLSTGGYVSWNTYKIKKYPWNYDQWYKGGTTTNPITWDNANQTDASKHLGVLNSDGKIYPNALSIERIDGMIWSTVPKIPKRFWLSFVKNYHFADINLFWKDIEKNAIDRLNAYQQKLQNNAR